MKKKLSNKRGPKKLDWPVRQMSVTSVLIAAALSVAYSQTPALHGQVSLCDLPWLQGTSLCQGAANAVVEEPAEVELLPQCDSGNPAVAFRDSITPDLRYVATHPIGDVQVGVLLRAAAGFADTNLTLNQVKDAVGCQI